MVTTLTGTVMPQNSGAILERRDMTSLIKNLLFYGTENKKHLTLGAVLSTLRQWYA